MARTRYQADSAGIPLRQLPAAALRAVWREGYTAAHFRHDVLAGVVVSIVALPLAMALAVAVGVAPQHGLYTAVVAGFVVAALGGSRNQVTGPTAAFIVILAPIHARFGMAGLLLSGLMGGLILLGMGLARLGRLIEFIPYPVTTGFTTGIATVIATLQVKDLVGLTLPRAPEHFLERLVVTVQGLPTATPWNAIVGATTLAVLIALPRLTKRVPAPLVALPLAAVLAAAINGVFPESVATIASRFHTSIAGHMVHGIPQLPPLPMIPWHAPGAGGHDFVFGYDVLRELMAGAFAVAMLGAIESLLSAVVADGMARTRHDPDAELIALGVGNIVTPFFGGIPATGAIARTATSIRSGGRSPVAAMVHALTIAAALLVLAPLLGLLPMSALAALLLFVAWNMSEAKHFVHILRVAPRGDAAVLLTCFGLTVLFDMVIGVTAGILLAAFLFMRRMAEVTETKLTSGGARPDLPGEIPPGVQVYEISGPLFFGAAQKAMSALGVTSDRVKAVILLMDRVSTMDATGLVALESALDQLKRNRCLAILCGVQAQPRDLLARAQVWAREGVVGCRDGVEALAAAARHMAAQSPSVVVAPTPASSSSSSSS